MSAIAGRLAWWARFFTQVAAYPRDLPLLGAAFSRRKHWRPPPEVWEAVAQVDGFLGLSEAGLLYQAARHWPTPGPVIELGSYEGRSTIILARAGRDVHAVDAWSKAGFEHNALGANMYPTDETFARFQDNLRRAGVADQVQVHRGLTTEVARGWSTPGAILFVDAGHGYADVQADLAAWTGHLHPEGLLLMHDTLSDRYKGVIRAASELLGAGWALVASAGTVVALARRPFARQVRPGHFGGGHA